MEIRSSSGVHTKNRIFIRYLRFEWLGDRLEDVQAGKHFEILAIRYTWEFNCNCRVEPRSLHGDDTKKATKRPMSQITTSSLDRCRAMFKTDMDTEETLLVRIQQEELPIKWVFRNRTRWRCPCSSIPIVPVGSSTTDHATTTSKPIRSIGRLWLLDNFASSVFSRFAMNLSSECCFQTVAFLVDYTLSLSILTI